MCIIIDTNKLAEFFGSPDGEDAAPVHKWIRGGARRLVFSDDGRFEEIGRNLRRRLRDLERAGRARAVPAVDLDNDARSLEGGGRMASDDPHILALARASGARLLYTADQRLMADFKNALLVSGPRGKVYSSAANVRLLATANCRSPTSG